MLARTIKNQNTLQFNKTEIVFKRICFVFIFLSLVMSFCFESEARVGSVKQPPDKKDHYQGPLILPLSINPCEENRKETKYVVTAGAPIYIHEANHSPLGPDWKIVAYAKHNAALEGCFDSANFNQFRTEIQINSDTTGKSICYLKKDDLADVQTTTIEDLVTFLNKLKKNKPFLPERPNSGDIISYPNTYIGKYISINFPMGIAENLEHDKNGGLHFEIFNENKGRCYFDVPFPAFAKDWQRGWDRDKSIWYVIGRIDRIGEFTNKLGMVFKIPIIEVVGIFDAHRFIY